MEAFSALLAFVQWIPRKGQGLGALLFSLIYAWINGWVNNREAGDLKRHRTHYDVIIMNLNFQTMEWLHCCLCYCSLWHHNATTVSSVTSQWGTHGGAISNQKALLMPPSFNNPHDINWIKLEFLGYVLIFALKSNTLRKVSRLALPIPSYILWAVLKNSLFPTNLMAFVSY